MTKMQQGWVLTTAWELALCLILAAGSASAQEIGLARKQAEAWRPVPREAIFETGDAWYVGADRYRLYGVQACLRGTIYTGPDGRKRDCGDVSLSMLAGLIRPLSPSCAPVARRPEIATAFVVCYADIITPRGRQRIDVGTALIASGFAFAALAPNGRPVNPGYFAAEAQAKGTRTGLWAFPDLPHPNIALLKALKAAPGATP